MVNKVKTAAIIGLDAYEITVEIDVINSIPGISIVGLPDASINEARDRVRSAIKNSTYTFPAKKVVINLAPADIKKVGAHFDLPIAVGILTEECTIDSEKIKDYAFLGELSLDGEIRGVSGVLPLVLGLKNFGIKNVFVPDVNVNEAALCEGINVFGAKHLTEVVNHFIENPIKQTKVDINNYLKKSLAQDYIYDFKDVKAQKKAKRAMEIAAAGAHNLLMIGSPGSGKTLMAKCFASILPPLQLEEALELTKIYSVCGLLPNEEPLVTVRPLRSVHHTASANGIIGGGSSPKPGEITLAHRGVLFLDEMAEFPRNVLEVLRQPLEDGVVSISRAKHSIKYPAKFMLLGAMNPCPCGYLGDKEKECTCTEYMINRYLSRISGPLLDRIDIQIEIVPVPFDKISDQRQGEPSNIIRQRVIKARQLQERRYTEYAGIYCNAQMNSKLLAMYAQPNEKGLALLKNAMERFNLSARAYDRILKVARTIADLEGVEQILPSHLAEAISYRNLDRENWAG